MDKLATVERFDNFAPLRNALRQIANDREGNWAGIPMPLDDHKLIIHPKYPHAEELCAMGGRRAFDGDDENTPQVTVRSRFYCRRWRCDVYTYEVDGRVRHQIVPAFHSLSHAVGTLGASVAWGIEQESNARQLLGTLVRHHQMKQYLLTGMFLESSERTGLTYLFRKLRPTVVLNTRNVRRYEIGETEAREPSNDTRIMCALCLHPLGYYRGTWAGAMCPTDDVIAHLMLMRADEPLLWRSATQHPPHRPEAGL